jgi:transcriptional regulator with XRE-family HTH domain
MVLQRSDSSPGAVEGRQTLGNAIAYYRSRRRRSQSRRGWSQEELAFASGTDQSHISRIENNQRRPEFATLERICGALGLSHTERAYVLALGGYLSPPDLPDEEAVDTILAELAPHMEMLPYPTCLVDDGVRQWYFNEPVARLWGHLYGSSEQRLCLALSRGRRPVEAVFDPDRWPETCAAWRATYENLDSVLTSVVDVFARAYRLRPRDEEMQAVVARLSRNPEFARRWGAAMTPDSDPLFYDQVILHPELGRLHLHVWRTRVPFDERFTAVHFTPVDGQTSDALARLSLARRSIDCPPRRSSSWPTVG